MEIWVDLNVHVLQVLQPQKFRQIFRWYSRYDKILTAYLRFSIYLCVLELSISQEIGLFEFLHQPFICGQTELFIHKTHLEKYRGVTGPNTLGTVSTHSGYSSEFSSMRGPFGTLNNFYFQKNTSPYISHGIDTMMTHYDTGGTKIP
jgi:hypothetical protein